jgi:regulator of protease activity HflC (stomatin/prohibitin superfamily)
MAIPASDRFKQAGNRIFRTPKGRLLYLVAAVGIALVVGFSSCVTYVRPNEFAIKQVTIGASTGIRPDTYRTGWHYVGPGEHLHRFPTDVQLLDLTESSSDRPRDDVRKTNAINIQTSEGYKVTVDITVLYRIEDPYKVITTVGTGKLYEDSLVIPRAELNLRKRLGELDAEEFYDVTKRYQRVAQALKDLSTELIPAGIRPTQIFVRRYVYDERYQHAIEQRKIQDQSVFKNKAEADMATANAEKDKIIAVGDAAVKVELARGDAEKRKIRAEAELYARKQRAAGELQVKLAEAEGTRLENEALRGVGSENMVGLKMADVLKGTRVIVVPTDGPNGLNPLDMKSALQRFDIK